MTFGEYVRTILLATMTIATLFLIFGTMRAWQHLSQGQKFFTVGLISWVIYSLDGMREAITIDLEWRWRLVFAVNGLVCLVAYLVEPQRSKRKRYGKDVLSSRHEHNDD